MSYTPHTWVDNETITAAKLNNIEDGVQEAAQSGGGALIVNYVSGALDKTFLEIYTALRDGIPSYVKDVVEADGPSADYQSYAFLHPIVTAHKYNNVYAVYVCFAKEGQVTGNYYVGTPCVTTFHATSVNDYPAFVGDAYATNVSFDD